MGHRYVLAAMSAGRCQDYVFLIAFIPLQDINPIPAGRNPTPVIITGVFRVIPERAERYNILIVLDPPPAFVTVIGIERQATARLIIAVKELILPGYFVLFRRELPLPP